MLGMSWTYGVSTVTPGPTIPLSLTDSRFASNTTGTLRFIETQTVNNKTYSQNPTYTDDTPSVTWDANASGNVATLFQCVHDWREGPRFAGTGSASNGSFVIDQNFVNCVGYNGDHADASQGFAGTPGPAVGTLDIRNTCFRAYTLAEAQSLYGNNQNGDAVTDSDCIFWGNDTQGTVKLRNVLCWGGSRGITVPADTGVVNIDFDGVYFVPSPGGWPGWTYHIWNPGTGGTLNIINWNNVFWCSIVSNTIVNLHSIPNPNTVVNNTFAGKGTVANSGLLPSSGNTPGDAYITSNNNHLWIWNGSSWDDEG